VLSDDFTQDAHVAAQALHNTGFGALESMRVLQKTFHAGWEALVSILTSLWSLSKTEAWTLPQKPVDRATGTQRR